MKIVKITGGFGNQLFQYAFSLALHKKHNEPIYLDMLDMANYRLHNGYELDNVFSLNANYCTLTQRSAVRADKNIFIKLYRAIKTLFSNERHYILEPKKQHFTFNPAYFGSESTATYYKGYWQHANYIEGIEQELRANLVFPAFTHQKNIELASYMASNETVSIHVRRGDYVQHKAFGGICDLSYYQRAIEAIKKQLKQPSFIVFSDDIAWCRDNLSLENAKFVDWNTGENSFCDMQLMSLCNHNIIANSSFSWWGAWLNAHEDKIVICPDNWVHYSDSVGVLPNSWQKIAASL